MSQKFAEHLMSQKFAEHLMNQKFAEHLMSVADWLAGCWVHNTFRQKPPLSNPYWIQRVMANSSAVSSRVPGCAAHSRRLDI